MTALRVIFGVIRAVVMVAPLPLVMLYIVLDRGEK